MSACKDHILTFPSLRTECELYTAHYEPTADIATAFQWHHIASKVERCIGVILQKVTCFKCATENELNCVSTSPKKVDTLCQ